MAHGPLVVINFHLLLFFITNWTNLIKNWQKVCSDQGNFIFFEVMGHESIFYVNSWFINLFSSLSRIFTHGEVTIAGE